MTTRLAAGATMTTTTTTAMVTKEGTAALPRQRTLGSERRGGRTKAGQQKKAGQQRRAVARIQKPEVLVARKKPRGRSVARTTDTVSQNAKHPATSGTQRVR